MKRLRKNYEGIEYIEKEDGMLYKLIRYFYCGEYGFKLEWLYYYVCLFNFIFFDKIFWIIRDGVKLYCFEVFEKLWSYDGKLFGYCIIGDVIF